MFLQDIGEDILLEILCLCDIYVVLSVSTVNKFFRRVALSKQLWLHLMQDLVSRGVLYRLSRAELDAYSTGDIIDEIKRIVCGPTTWAPMCSSEPTVHRQLTFHTGANRNDIFDLMLTPGGTHAILKTIGNVRLYDVRTGRCLWTKAGDQPSIATDLAESGNILRILLVPGNYSENANVTIEEVNLTTGESHEVFSFPLPPDSGSNLWWCSDLRENFLILHLYAVPLPGGHIFILVDWCKRKQVLLTYDQRNGDLRPRLLRDHIVVTYNQLTPSGQARPYLIAVTAFAALEAYWHPLNVDSTTMEFSESESIIFSFPLNPQAPSKYIPITAVTGLQLQNKPIHAHDCYSFFVYENPVHHDTYRIMMLLGSNSYPFTPENRVLLTYTLFTPNPLSDTPPRFQPVSAFRTLRDYYGGDAISYAGYTVQYPMATGIVMDLKCERALSRSKVRADRQIQACSSAYLRCWRRIRRTKVASIKQQPGTSTEDGFEVVKAAPEWEQLYFSPRNGAVLGVVNGSAVVNYFK